MESELLLVRIFCRAKPGRHSKMATGCLLFLMLTSLSMAEARSVYDHMLFHPRQQYSSMPTEINGVKKREVTFLSSHGQHLRGWLFDLAGSDKIGLVSEGNGSNMAYLARLSEILMQCNASVLLYDYERWNCMLGSGADDSSCIFLCIIPYAQIVNLVCLLF